MTKVDYDIDLDILNLEDYSFFMDCVDEAAYEDGRSKEEIIDNQDLHSERYYDKACEKYHFHNQKIGKTLRALQDLDVYEVTEDGQVNFHRSFRSRQHLGMFLDGIYKLHSAFAFCPKKALGYVIHGNVQKCKEHVNTLRFLYTDVTDKEITQ